MRLEGFPALPSEEGGLIRALTIYLERVARQVNASSEGQITGATNARTAIPTTGTYVVGDFIRNSAPSAATPILGWVCVASGTPGTWKEVGWSIAAAVATWLTTPTSANLRAALTDESGTGAALFQNGDLGTPSAGVLTNATGLPLTTGVAGILGVANGGTGRATSTTAYGLLAAGTTAAGIHQTLPAGATTEILVGGGAAALPAWTAATGTGAPVRQTAAAVGGIWTAAAAWTLPAHTLGGTVTSNGQSFSGTIADLGTVTTADINGGTVDGAVVGGASAAAGSFTTLNASGLISANGGQIAFPAAQNASAGANTLDDYEEGTFTPSLAGSTTAGTQTYAARAGTYTKIGNRVLVTSNVALSAKDAATAGNLQITGFPFTTNANYQFALAVGICNSFDLNVAGGYYRHAANMPNNTTRADLLEIGDNVAGASLTAVDFIATSFIYLNGSYIV